MTIDKFVPTAEAGRMFAEAISCGTIFRVLYSHAYGEEALEYRLVPIMMDGLTDVASSAGCHMVLAQSFSNWNGPRLPLPRILRLKVGRFVSIEKTAGILHPMARSREKELAQLQECLVLVFSRFRSWVPSVDDLDDCRARLLLRLWNEPTVHNLIGRGRLAELNNWLLSCARNELLNWKRSRTRASALAARAASSFPAIVSPHEFIDLNIQLQQTLDRMRPSQARLLHLAFVEGLSPEEIALLEGRTVVAVRKAISRAREVFRVRWDSEEW